VQILIKLLNGSKAAHSLGAPLVKSRTNFIKYEYFVESSELLDWNFFYVGYNLFT